MKIDAFSVNFSSSRTFSQTQTVEFTDTYTFSEVMEGLPDGAQLSGNPQETSGANPWSQSVNAENLDVGTLTQQFLAQLENLRHITVDVLDQFQSQLSISGTFTPASLDQVYTGPVLQNDFLTFSQWEHTRTTTYTYEEQESVNVTAGGTIRTADNREFDFSMDLLMERRFFNESSVQKTESGYTLIDPLVVQTGAQSPMFGGARFSFDLDMDGETEDLAGLSSGYAFLALDSNNDGKINDGSELFGPTTGDGFYELAAYDQDNNMWIDENDEIFDQLVLWNPDAETGTTLTSLKDAGLGAIYLGGVSSQFSLTGEDNQMLGQITGHLHCFGRGRRRDACV